jgi:hypothetical protein
VSVAEATKTSIWPKIWTRHFFSDRPFKRCETSTLRHLELKCDPSWVRTGAKIVSGVDLRKIYGKSNIFLTFKSANCSFSSIGSTLLYCLSTSLSNQGGETIWRHWTDSNWLNVNKCVHTSICSYIDNAATFEKCWPQLKVTYTVYVAQYIYVYFSVLKPKYWSKLFD